MCIGVGLTIGLLLPCMTPFLAAFVCTFDEYEYVLEEEDVSCVVLEVELLEEELFEEGERGGEGGRTLLLDFGREV